MSEAEKVAARIARMKGNPPPEPGKNGRPKHVVTATQQNTVKWLYINGYTQEKIAEIMGIALSTLRTHYWNELEAGKAQVDAAMTQSLVLQGLGGPEQDWTKAVPAATFFYLKTRSGFRELDRVHHTGVIGMADLEHLKAELKGMSDGDLAQLERLLSGPGAASGDDS